MEFGIFVQGHVPRAKVEREGKAAEHNTLMGDIEVIKAADRYGWKYAWVTEHHFLEEYSHLSASEVVLAYAAAVTERIHLGSGITNLNPKVNHPARVAERTAMLDHLSNGRFELGTGRGAGSREVTGFDIESTDVTKVAWDEVIAELPRMWRESTYAHEGDAFRMPFPNDAMPTRNVLPKPYLDSHPPLWLACGNPPTYAKAGSLGLGALGFNVSAIKDMAPMVEAYKKAVANAEPVGEYVNDNVMITNGLVCADDGRTAREIATNMGISYLQTQVFYYHDTMPKVEGFPVWPEHLAEPSLDDIEFRINEGFLLCGDPDEVVEQVARYEAIGCDQLVFGLPLDMPLEVALDTIRLFGEHVIPKFDHDPVHRTDRMRASASASTSG